MKIKLWKALKRWFPNQSHGYNEALSEAYSIIVKELKSKQNPYTEEPRIHSKEYELGWERCRKYVVELFEGKYERPRS